ncbi:unnamed protein product [Blepharisma stoltei]|uniref:3-hydroxybutyryl-CoA dehydrogenase n=1 Tax=Blepharisma stoltei TaxID=1481888 RepID=A0AAU9KBN7_9CILI|nr:unnamed protein product [Blepharisma stoltei]
MKPGLLLGILGAGEKGLRIALLASRNAKFNVKLIDTCEKNLSYANLSMETLLMSMQTFEAISDKELYEIPQRISVSTKIDALEASDFVIECIHEDLDAKRNVFRNLEQIVRNDTIIASKSSKFPITQIAHDTSHPERIIGLSLKWVDFKNCLDDGQAIIRPGLQTSHSTIHIAIQFVKSINCTPLYACDSLGFMKYRDMYAFINESTFQVKEDLSTIKDIDEKLKSEMKIPFGPFELADLIGLEDVYAKLEKYYQKLEDERFKPSKILKKYISAGWTGKKAGRGFYEYH